MLEKVVETYAKSPVDEVIVVLGFAADEIQKGVSFGGAKVVLNPDFAEGLASSLRVGVRSVNPKSQAAVVGLGDQPLLTAKTVAVLIERFQGMGGAIVAPYLGRRRGNPVLFARHLFGELESAHGDEGAKSVIRSHQNEVVQVEVVDKGVVFDVDSEEDYRRALAELSTREAFRRAPSLKKKSPQAP
jgi:molybdenum cofactor cytidylyltransferase